MRQIHTFFLLFFCPLFCLGQISIATTTTESRCSADGSMTVNASGGTPPYTYSLTGAVNRPAQSTNRFLALPRGTYTVTVVDAANQRNAITVSVSGNYVPPTLSLLVNQSMATLSVAGGRLPLKFTYQRGGIASGDTSSTGVFRCLLNGNYRFQVIDSCGNFYPFDAVINVDTLNFSTVCSSVNGLPSLSVSTAKGGTPPYFYFCRSNLGQLDSNATGVFINLRGCSFDVTMRDACGKTLTKTADCAGDPLSIKVICSNASNGTATVNVTGGTLPYSVLTEVNSGKTATNGVFTNLPLKKTYRFEVKDACNRLVVSRLDTFQIYNVTTSACPFDSTVSFYTSQYRFDGTYSYYNYFNPVTYRCLNCPPSVQATVIDSTLDKGSFRHLPEGTYDFDITNACGERITRSVNLKKTNLNLYTYVPCDYIYGFASTASKYYLKIGNSIVDSNTTGRLIPAKPNQSYKVLATSPDCGSDSSTVNVGFSATAENSCDTIAVLPCPNIGNYRFDLKNALGQIIGTSTTGIFRSLTNSTTYTCDITHVPSGERLATPLSIRTDLPPKLSVRTLSFCSVELILNNNYTRLPVGTVFQVYDSTTNQLVLTATDLRISGLRPNTAYRIVAVYPVCGSAFVYVRSQAISPPEICVAPSFVLTGLSTCTFGWDVKITPNTDDLVLKNLSTNALVPRQSYFYSPNFPELLAGKYQLSRENGCALDTIDLPKLPENYLKLTAPPSCPQGGRIVATGGFKVADWRALVRPKSLIFCDTSRIDMTYSLRDSAGYTLYDANYRPIQNQTGIFDNLQQGKLYKVACGNLCSETQSIRVPLYVRSVLAATPTPVCNGATSGDLTATIVNGSPPYTFEIRETGARIQSDSPRVVFNNLPLGNYTLRAFDFCQISSDFAVAVAPLSITTNFADRRCSDSVRLNATPVNGATYVWKNGLGQIIGNTNSIFVKNENNAAQNYTLSLTNGTCQILQNLIVPAMTAPIFNTNAGNDTSGVGLSLPLNGTPIPTNGSGFWQALTGNPSTAIFANNASPNSLVSVTVAGRYGFVWTVNSGINGCISRDSVFITFINCIKKGPLSINVQKASPPTCDASGSIKITVNNPDSPLSFRWSNGATTDVVSRLAAGNYQVTISDADICTPDTTLSIVLIKPIFSANLDTSVCSGTIFKLDTFQFSTAVQRQLTLKTGSGGCDSLVNLTLRLRRVEDIALDKNLCFGQNVKLGDTTILTSGVYQKTLSNTEGCDSTVRLTAFFQQKTDATRVLKTCNPTAVGTITTTFRNRFGCDSLVLTTQTTLARRDSMVLEKSICKGDSVRFGAILLKNTGIFTRILRNTEGCDSTEILALTVNKPDTIRRAETTCDLTAVGTRRDTFQNSFGCSSLTLTTKTFSPKDSASKIGFTCDSTKVGQEDAVFRNRLGCDSIITTITQLARHDRMTPIKTICSGDSLQFGSIWLKNAGIFSQNNVNTEGCDSTVILTLVIKKPDTTRLTDKTCDITLVGTTSRLRRNQFGCDSLIFTTLTLRRPDTTRLNDKTCDATLVGTTSRLRRNQFGCDSLIFTTLTFKKSDTIRLNRSICAGDSSLFDGIWRKIGGIFTQKAVNTEGCDSLRILTLTINPRYAERVERRLCAGDSTAWRGRIFKENGVFSFRQVSVTGGCDSIFEITIFINAKINIQTQQRSPNCQNANSGAVSLQISGGTRPFTVRWSNGATDSLLGSLAAGQYTALVTDFAGCRDSVRVVLPMADSLTLDVDLVQPRCFEDKTGQIVVKNAVGRGQLDFNVDGKKYPLSILPLKLNDIAVGEHRFILTDSTGCILDKKMSLTSPPSRFLTVQPKDTTVALGDSFTIRSSVNFIPKSIVWSPRKEGLSCDTCLSPNVLARQNKRFVLQLTDENGCVSASDIIVRTQLKGLYIPNIFAPESVNNLYSVYASSSIERIERLRIFDRWGEMVYQSENDFSSSVSGWNGYFRGQLAPPSVYVVVVDVLLKNGERRVETGDVTLIR